MNPFVALETDELAALRGLLVDGLDPNTERDGLTLLEFAYDVESDGETQRGAPFRVDSIALLLAWGADPRRNQSVLRLAHLEQRWLVIDLLERLVARAND